MRRQLRSLLLGTALVLAASPALAQESGDALFATHCASCHGALGAGDGPVAAALTPKPAALSTPAFQDARTDEQLLSAIRDGGPAVGKSPLMPGFGTQLSAEQLQALVAHVRALRVDGAPGAETPSTDTQEAVDAQGKAGPLSTPTPTSRRALNPNSPFSRTRFHLAGFATAHFQYTKESGPNFASVQLAPVFLWRLHDQILFEAELEFGYGGGEFDIALEYAQLDFILWDYTTVVTGLSLLPLGIYTERLHPGWINRMMDAPYPYQGGHHGGPIPMSGLGVQARGAVPLGNVASINYAAFLTNGPGEASGSIALSGAVPDNNWNKFVGGRVGILPLRELEIGISGATGLWDDDVSMRYSTLIADVMASTGWGLSVQGEYITTRTDVGQDDPEVRHLWWAQLAWRLLPLPGILSRFEIVARYGGAVLPGDTVAEATAEALEEARVRFEGTRVVFSAGHDAAPVDEHGTEDNVGLPAGFTNQIAGGVNFYPIPSIGIRLGAHYTFETRHFHFGATVAAGF